MLYRSVYSPIDDVPAQIPDGAPPRGGRVGRGFFLGTIGRRHDISGELLRARSGSRGQRSRPGGAALAYGVKPADSIAGDAVAGVHNNSTSDSPVPDTGRFTQVHLDVFDGRMVPTVWDDGGGPDSFEVEIGNRIAYAAPLHEAGRYFRELRSQWLPYYGEELRLSRLTMVRKECARDLEAIPFYLNRGLYFQAFDRLYKAFQEFLQALFVARRTYPLAYNKWIREQVADWLALPELYEELSPILSVRNIERRELGDKADALRTLLER